MPVSVHHPASSVRQLCVRLAAINRSGKRLLMCVADGVALPLCLVLAMMVITGGMPPWPAALLLTALSISALSMASLYGAALRQLEQRTLFLAGMALGAAIVALYLLTRDGAAARIPGPVLAMYWPLAMLYLIASRAGMRALLRSLLHHQVPPPTDAASRGLPDFALEQLLGRAPVQPDSALFARCVRGKNVLVTGAGGSIGSELCRQIASLAPRCLHLIDHSEFALYTIAQELRARWPQLVLHAHLGSVCSERMLERVMDGAAIHTIYHAAAYKHVSIVETNMVEGLRNNVVGARNVANAAARHGVHTCVLVSSDKAVRPSTIMGASKRLSELVFQAAQDEGASVTTFSMVRFGNVLGSSGSVVPLFRQQLQQGGPLTITDAAMERYFMLIPEAAQLVIQAGAMAEGGEVFVLDMGAPLRIVDLARRMIALAGLTERTPRNPQGDIDIRYVGLCPGEKLQEELLIADGATPSRHPRILCMKEQALPAAQLDQYLELLLVACASNDRWLIEAMLKTIITEFTPQTGVRATDSEAALRRLRVPPLAAVPPVAVHAS
ncbi:nucleoside-diphosphate sugar epimerase/dehydratase [Duganella sp. FT27W]|uniref:nucleoside-diphosphate sugar epimerase/dehydratase n=1 Tax=Duganella sp. FT27W TaxID=2654636 RepID=UPI00128D0563|nr:polysaccharide biosynthesis protein [Duganella sp. FT27W]MPQ55395.1 NAD-dependent epimerase/dehydratase family protein [Duganella sp. FT27W]